ncbi:uncharacterized protein LOC125771112 isoform X2 [Anopheles funestus]|uniref:uncharacterized protein LOC125771112 isoform X2 n=1 Tax=Anopheles funestus TaxID=62324 RepID=UPI0020C5CC61|nr:uncharacterized protein LOC125771112 isoform X2 [Anopheles funestus]
MSLTHHVLPSCVILYGLVCVLPMGKYAAGSYLRDVELIGPSSQAELNTVYYYPSYVKGEDPVEEYNRRRLHVDTANFMEYETNRPNGVEQPRHNQQRQAYEKPNETDDECCLKVKRKRKYHGQSRYPKQHAIDPMRVVDAQTDHEQNYKKIRQTGAGVPRYVRDDVELFDIERGNRIKAKRPIRRRTRTAHASRTNEQRPRYEESDPQIFAYERSDAIASGRADTDQPRTSQDNQYFQYAEIFGDGSFTAGARRGNDQHYLEQLERGSHNLGVFQKKVKWADKQGGFGEHYWDLNHIQPNVPAR